MRSIRSFFLSVRMDGLGASIRRGWIRLFGQEDWYVFVRHPTTPSTPVELPVETNGITVRHMTESDVDEVSRLMPFDLDRRPPRERRERLRDRLADTMVATRGTRIVGATCCTDHVTPEQPWYHVVERELIPPARFTASIFVVPGDKGAAWAIAKNATEHLATRGVRTVVGLIQCHNKPSILVTRLLGGKMVARVSVRHWFGRRTTVVAAVAEQQAFSAGDDASGLRPGRAESPHRGQWRAPLA